MQAFLYPLGREVEVVVSSHFDASKLLVDRDRQLSTLRELAVRTAGASSPEEACQAAALALAENPSDIPFALFYLFEEDGRRARVAASCPIAPVGEPASAPFVAIRGDEPPTDGWPLGRLAEERRAIVVSDLSRRFGALPGGGVTEAPTSAVVLPIAAGGELPQGALVAGLSPGRELDDGYRTFLEIAAAQVSAALRAAREREAESRRSERLAEIDRAQSELRRLEEEHRITEAARERLAETLRLNELFVGVLGHDLRTPLSAISLGAAILLKRSALRPDDARAVVRIASSADRIARMIGQVLDLTRARLGDGIPVRRARLDLHELARRVVDELKLAHAEATIQLRLEGDGCGEWDPDRLAQVVSNLGGNAVQHGAQAPVTIAVTGTRHEVSLAVHNSGPPIPAESLDTIFDAFRGGTRSSAGSTGLGLGLYITREIVRAHGGTILVRSTESEGTTFTAVLPRAADARALAQPGAAAPAAGDLARHPRG